MPMHAERDIDIANLSVRHTLFFIETNAHIVKLFPPNGRGITLVFWALPSLQNSKGYSLSGALNTRGGENLRFSTDIAVYLETVRDRPMVTMDH